MCKFSRDASQLTHMLCDAQKGKKQTQPNYETLKYTKFMSALENIEETKQFQKVYCC